MSDGVLSQDEINALLAVSSDEKDEEFTSHDAVINDVSDYLSSIEEDTLGEIGNISFGSSATTLSTLLNEKVDITTPTVSIVQKSNLYKDFDFDHVTIQVNYVSGFIGDNLFIIKAEDAAIISDIMLGGNGTSPDNDLNDIHLSAVQEAMNQMMGAAATSMSTIFNKLVNISPPTIELGIKDEPNKLDETMGSLEDETLVQVSFQLKVGNLIDSNIMQLISFPFANEMVAELLNTSTESQESQEPKETKEVPTTTVENIPTSTQYLGNKIDQGKAQVRQASFTEFEQVELNQNEHRNLDMLLDIPLKVTVELGRTKRPIKDILDLSSGSIIELDKLAGEPVDILINQKLIAQGEVVVIDENFGVRVTDIISKTARLMNLNN